MSQTRRKAEQGKTRRWGLSVPGGSGARTGGSFSRPLVCGDGAWPARKALNGRPGTPVEVLIRLGRLGHTERTDRPDPAASPEWAERPVLNTSTGLDQPMINGFAMGKRAPSRRCSELTFLSGVLDVAGFRARSGQQIARHSTSHATPSRAIHWSGSLKRQHCIDLKDCWNGTILDWTRGCSGAVASALCVKR